MATRASHDNRVNGGEITSGLRGRWSQQQSQRRDRTGGSCGSSRDNNCDSWRNNTQLLNHGSNFRRNNAFRLEGYNGNSVNNDNPNRTGAVDNYMLILLTFSTFSNGANLEKNLVPCVYYLLWRSCS